VGNDACRWPAAAEGRRINLDLHEFDPVDDLRPQCALPASFGVAEAGVFAVQHLASARRIGIERRRRTRATASGRCRIALTQSNHSSAETPERLLYDNAEFGPRRQMPLGIALPRWAHNSRLWGLMRPVGQEREIGSN
jgi:hypothetical protein